MGHQSDAKKNKTVLEIARPIINHTPVNDGILSILGLTEQGKATAYENFIEIRFHKNLNELVWIEFGEPFRFCGLSTLKTYIIPQELLQNNFEEFITESLNQGMYCLYNHETSIVDQYVNYQKKQIRHEVFAYGRDADTLYCSDYFDYSHYSSKCVKFSQAIEARNAWLSSGISDYLGGVICYKPVAIEGYKANISIIYKSLKELMYGVGMSNSITEKQRGFDFFEALERHLADDSITMLAAKLFSFVKAHTTMMGKRMEYLSITFGLFNNDMLNRIKSITHQANLLVNLTIKYNLTLDKLIRERMQKLLRTITQQYEKLIFDMIVSIEYM